MKTTVLIPTHGRPTLLEETLVSLAACALPESYHELVVIENGSRAGAEQIVESLPSRLHARYMHDSWGNKSNALNKAIETIDSGLVVFFDDDVEIHPDTLVSYSMTAQEYGPGHFYGGDVRVDRDGRFPDGFANQFPASTTGYDATDRVGRDGMVFLGFNWAAFKEDLDRMGGFNTLLGPGSPIGTSVGDESELQQRMVKEEIRPIAVSRAIVTHHVPAEHTTLRWLLRRKYHVGVFIGVTTSKRNQEWVPLIRGILRAFIVALKGALLVDNEKTVTFILFTCQSVGKAKGYLSDNEFHTRP
jgi:glycosyltransferase involved in cell wall biosynthesis